ncbi:MAG: DegT/DnrJ/EryC1/StrS family aminotransferase [Candidatus Acidiferrales bacterium]
MAEPVLGERELELASQAVRSGWISSQGGFVADFEDAFSRYCGVAHGVAVSSGTAALHVALAALGIEAGDEVLVPGITHIAVANAVTLTGARPVAVDCHPQTWTLDPEHAARKISPRTRALIAVHLYGHPCDIDPLQALSEKHGFHLLEDAAEAHGATYRSRRTGSLGKLACFSFYANKIITTGEGGMLLTDDAALAARCRKLRNQAHEADHRFRHRELGFNYRLTNLQAAIGLAQMERIDEFVEIRRRNAHLYTELLEGLPGLTPPPEAPWAKNVHWMYALLVEEPFGLSRDDLMATLAGQGIETRPFFHPLHQQPLYENLFRGESLPVSERLGRAGLNLPSGNNLTEAQVRRVVSAIRSGRAGRA